MPHHNNGEILKNDYRIIQYIDQGTFGETYLVEDIQLPGSKRLLKYLSYQTTDIETLVLIRRLFERESKTLSLLGNHDQIPQLYDYFEENQKFYLVQEYIEGINLENELNNKGNLAEKEVIQILHEVLNVLQYLEQNKVIHRDIKPANLMRRESDNKIIMIDFGAVKQVSTLTLNAHGQLNPTIIGTPGYMPKEQSDGQPEYTSDIYALGMTAIQLLTGQKPINLYSDNEVIWENLISVNPHLAKILTKMVRISLRDRYSTANEVLAHLKPLTFLDQTLIQRYKIINYLGGSGFSHTYSAEDTCSAIQNRRCIVKQFILTNHNLHIFNEVRSRLKPALVSQKHSSLHKQVPHLSDNFIEGTTLYLVYEFIDGENLSDKIKTGKHWNEAEIIAFLKDVLELLSPIHQQGIIHGDIKPSNLIQRTEDKKFILIDFSKFKQVFTLEYSSGSIVEKPGGTDGYMPFEQKDNQPEPSSDIYALGMTAIQLLTGVHPQSLKKDLRKEVILPNGIQISSKLARILTKMVRFHLGDRYQSAQEVLKDLKNLKNLDPGLETQGGIIQWLKKHWPTSHILGVISSIGIGIAISYVLFIQHQKNHYINTGNVWLNQGENFEQVHRDGEKIQAYNEAIKNYGDALKLDPKDIEVLVAKGYVHGKLRQGEEQLFTCTTATQVDPKSYKAWNCLGNAQYLLENYSDAINSYKKAQEESCNSSNPNLLNDCANNLSNEGDALSKLTQYQEAIQAYDKALQEKPDHKQAKEGKENAQKLLNRYSVQ